jgi:NitT/TauT family transport system substrate-binding protein
VVAGATYWGVTWNAKIAPTKSAAGLKDLRIATYEAPSTNYSLMAKTLKDEASAVGRARIVQGAYGTLLAMLKADQADVAMELEPVASTAVKEGAHIVYSYPEMYGPFMLTGLYVLESYRDQNRATVQAAVNALERATRFAHGDVSGAVEVARKKFPEIDPEVAQTAVARMVHDNTLPKDVTLDPAGWENTIQVRLDLGDLKSRAAADATLDASFSQAAVRDIGAPATH